ncbi:MAG: hypothetical protein ACJAZ8_000670, partial [Planctomycetota bacterium]
MGMRFEMGEPLDCPFVLGSVRSQAVP